MSCSWLIAGCQGTSVTAFCPTSYQAELYLLNWLNLQKAQNRPLKWSGAVKSSYAHNYVLGGFTIHMGKTSGGSFQTTDPWTTITQRRMFLSRDLVFFTLSSTNLLEFGQHQQGGRLLSVQSEETPAPESSPLVLDLPYRPVDISEMSKSDCWFE